MITPIRPYCCRTRRGGAYLAVLGVAVIVSMSSLCAMHLVRIDRQAVTARSDMAQARLAAQSAIEFGMARIDSDGNWRNTYTHGVNGAYPAVSLGSAELNFQLHDADSDLADDDTDAVTIRGRGQAGDAVYVYTVTVAPDSEGDMRIVPGSWQRTTDQ